MFVVVVQVSKIELNLNVDVNCLSVCWSESSSTNLDTFLFVIFNIIFTLFLFCAECDRKVSFERRSFNLNAWKWIEKVAQRWLEQVAMEWKMLTQFVVTLRRTFTQPTQSQVVRRTALCQYQEHFLFIEQQKMPTHRLSCRLNRPKAKNSIWCRIWSPTKSHFHWKTKSQNLCHSNHTKRRWVETILIWMRWQWTISFSLFAFDFLFRSHRSFRFWRKRKSERIGETISI